MPWRIQVVSLAICVGMLLLVLELVRRRSLREEYSQLWFATWIGILVLIIWFDLLKWITHVIGAVSPVSTIFFFALLFLIAISLHFSIVISRLTNKLKDLAQHYALLENELASVRKMLDK